MKPIALWLLLLHFNKAKPVLASAALFLHSMLKTDEYRFILTVINKTLRAGKFPFLWTFPLCVNVHRSLQL